MAAIPTGEYQAVLAKICAQRCECPPFPEPNSSIGYLKDGKLVGGVTYTSYTGREIWASIWVDDRSVWTRQNVGEMFHYPFVVCGVTRLVVIVRETNEKSLKMCSQMGFVKEGVLRKYFEDDVDAIIMSMLKEECKWI